MNGIVEFIKDENLHQITSLTAADKAILQLLPTFFNSLNSSASLSTYFFCDLLCLLHCRWSSNKAIQKKFYNNQSYQCRIKKKMYTRLFRYDGYTIKCTQRASQQNIFVQNDWQKEAWRFRTAPFCSAHVK